MMRLATLFHEFGHGLHHMLTQIDVAGVAGINGVPWDAVELPSQFLEKLVLEPEALAVISGHYETGSLAAKQMDKLLAAKISNPRCKCCGSWSLHCLISVCTANMTRNKVAGYSRSWMMSVAKQRCSYRQHLTASSISFSHIFGGVMRRLLQL